MYNNPKNGQTEKKILYRNLMQGYKEKGCFQNGQPLVKFLWKLTKEACNRSGPGV